jgi:hypothetical protein
MIMLEGYTDVKLGFSHRGKNELGGFESEALWKKFGSREH